LQRRIFDGFWLETFQSFLGDLNENKSPLNPVLSKVNMGPVFEVALDRALPTFKRFRKSVCRSNNQQGGSLIHHGQQERDQGVRVGYEVYSSHARFFVDDAKRLRGTRFFAVLPNLRPQQKNGGRGQKFRSYFAAINR
jgi:hypothetical protein